MGLPHTKQMTFVHLSMDFVCMREITRETLGSCTPLVRSICDLSTKQNMLPLLRGGFLDSNHFYQNQNKSLNKITCTKMLDNFCWANFLWNILKKQKGDPASTFPTILCGSWWLRDQNSLTKTILGDIKQCYVRKICPD